MLIYVAAFLPGDGQSLLDLTAYPEAADDQVQANLVIDEDQPIATMPATAAREALFGCCDDEQAAWGVARLGGQPVVPFGQPVSLGDPPAAAFAALGRAYITCLSDRAIPPAMQRRMFEAAGCDPVIEIDTDHAPWISRTGELVAALLEEPALLQATPIMARHVSAAAIDTRARIRPVATTTPLPFSHRPALVGAHDISRRQRR